MKKSVKKEPKFKIGQRVCFKNTYEDRIIVAVINQVLVFEDKIDYRIGDHWWPESELKNGEPKGKK